MSNNKKFKTLVKVTQNYESSFRSHEYMAFSKLHYQTNTFKNELKNLYVLWFWYIKTTYDIFLKYYINIASEALWSKTCIHKQGFIFKLNFFFILLVDLQIKY